MRHVYRSRFNERNMSMYFLMQRKATTERKWHTCSGNSSHDAMVVAMQTQSKSGRISINVDEQNTIV